MHETGDVAHFYSETHYFGVRNPFFIAVLQKTKFARFIWETLTWAEMTACDSFTIWCIRIISEAPRIWMPNSSPPSPAALKHLPVCPSQKWSCDSVARVAECRRWESSSDTQLDRCSGYPIRGRVARTQRVEQTRTVYLTVTPSFSSTRTPFSWYSSLVSQKFSLSFMMSASTAPPRNTMCLRRGGSSIRILNFCRVVHRQDINKTQVEIVSLFSTRGKIDHSEFKR